MAQWNAFVHAHADASFFHLAEWQTVLHRAFGHRPYFLFVECNGEIRGVLPLVELKSRLFGHALVSTPFCVYGGIVASDAQAFAALEEAAMALARGLDVDYLEMRNRQPRHSGWMRKDLYCTFIREFTADPDKNLQAIPRKQRAMVRKAIQRGLAVDADGDIDTLYRMYSESVRNLGTPIFAKRYLSTLREVFGENAQVLTVRHEGQPVSSVLSFRFRDQILPYYGGGTAAARSVAGNDFMYWAVMERARGEGLKVFDFGRSKRDTGAFDFKTNWGFEPQPLCYEYYLVRARQMPDLSPKNPRYETMIRLWKKLPLPLANILGPPLAKYLG